MPLLSFQVQADYDKVIRLRSEIEKLKSEMKSVNAVFDADRFNAYNKRIKEMTTEFNALVDKAAKAGAESTSRLRAMSKTVDLSNPLKELKKFDEQVLGMCKNLDGYFGFLKGKLQETLTMLNEVGSIANKVKVDDKNAVHIEELKRQNAELTSEIQRQIAAYGEQQSQFQALANAVRSNNIPALQQFTQQEDEASKRLKLDEARNSLKGVTDDMKSLAAQMADRYDLHGLHDLRAGPAHEELCVRCDFDDRILFVRQFLLFLLHSQDQHGGIAQVSGVEGSGRPAGEKGSPVRQVNKVMR